MKSMGWILSALLAVGVFAPAPSVLAEGVRDNHGDIITEIAPLQRFLPFIQTRIFTYDADEIMFSPTEEEVLKDVALRLRGTTDRVLLTAHSGDAHMSKHEGVKLSYKRAMIIRNYLLRHGVDAKQVDIEALGAPEGNAPTDRVVMTAIPPKR